MGEENVDWESGFARRCAARTTRQCSGMSRPDETKPEPRPDDPEAVAKALEIELMLKRAGWQRARARRGTWRALSLLFLLLVIVVALAAWFYLVPALSRRGESTPPPATADSSR